jgi:hypothetical protein
MPAITVSEIDAQIQPAEQRKVERERDRGALLTAAAATRGLLHCELRLA